MNLLEITLDTPAENLALDEALLLAAEESVRPQETLRLWEPAAPMVVVGRASRVEEEVDVEACRALDIPIFRRSSGGATIITGPGCLMYAVVLGYEHRPHLRMIDQAHRFVLGKLAAGVEQVTRPLRDSKSTSNRSGDLFHVQLSGTSDLTLDGRMKFSGNSLRCCRTHLLYHGTLLYDFPLEIVERCLRTPPRQPEYRQGRRHEEFVANIDMTRDGLRRAVVAGWRDELAVESRTEFQVRPPNRTDLEVRATDHLDDDVRALTLKLTVEKYNSDQWNHNR